jgi:tight adherence protein B
MDVVAFAAALAVMGAIITGLYALYQSTASPRSNMERRLGNLMGEANPLQASAADFEALRTRRESKVPILGSLMKGSLTNDLGLELERADMNLTVSEFLALRFFFLLAGLAMPLLLIGSPIKFLVALPVGFVGYQLPKIYLSMAKGRRQGKLDGQLPDMLSMLANSLKAGFGLMQSMDMISKEMDHPISTEIQRVLQEINVGAATDAALANMAKRSGSPDLDIVVTAMLIQQSTGGNLAEILDTVAHTMRERIRIRGEIKTLTTQQMMTGYVIGALPLFVGVAISLFNPGYISILFHNIIGLVMLGVAFLMECFGIFLIKRILAIEV